MGVEAFCANIVEPLGKEAGKVHPCYLFNFFLINSV